MSSEASKASARRCRSVRGSFTYTGRDSLCRSLPAQEAQHLITCLTGKLGLGIILSMHVRTIS